MRPLGGSRGRCRMQSNSEVLTANGRACRARHGLTARARVTRGRRTMAHVVTLFVLLAFAVLPRASRAQGAPRPSPSASRLVALERMLRAEDQRGLGPEGPRPPRAGP